MDADELSSVVEAARRMLLDGGDPCRLAADLCDAGIGDLTADWPLVGALFTAQGETIGTSTLLDLLVAGPLYQDDLRVVLPMPGSPHPPARTDAGLAVSGVVLSVAGAKSLLVYTADRAGLVLAQYLSVEAVGGLDPRLGLGVVSGTVDEATMVPVSGLDWPDVVSICRRALAHELLGVGRTAFGIGMTHVINRHQFGAPLATLQSVRHRLVDVHVKLEAARGLLDDTAVDDETELTGMVVKAAAGQAALSAAAAAQQLCGAMGFTAEHDLHPVVRRAMVIDALLCGATDLEAQIGAVLAARATAPRLSTI